MSSILDALKKLEDEKTKKKDAVERAHIEKVAAERDLTRRRRTRQDDEVIRVNSTILVLIGLATAVVLVAVSVIAALVIMRTMSGARVAANQTPATAVPAESTPLATPPVETAPFQPVPMDAGATTIPAPTPLEPVTSEPAFEEPLSAPEPVDSMVPAEPVVWVEPEPPSSQAMETVVPEPPAALTPAPARPQPPEAAAPPPESYTPQPVPTAPPAEYSDVPIGEIDLNTLPVLTESERVRLGLPHMKINIVGLPTKRQPRPSALINFEKVYLGEYIKNTRARLVAVELHGVGIEVAGNRYFMEK